MGRRRRKMRKPGTGGGPRHNDANRHTRASKQKSRLLDEAKRDHFRYYARETLEGSSTPDEKHAAIIQTLWAKGSRQSVDDAREFLDEMKDEGVIDDDQRQDFRELIQRYSTHR